MDFEVVLIALPLYCGVALRLRIIQRHGLVEEIEPLNLVYSERRGLHTVENDECLPLCFQVLLGDDVDDVAIVAENVAKSLLQLFDFDALFEVSDLSGNW